MAARAQAATFGNRLFDQLLTYERRGELTSNLRLRKLRPLAPVARGDERLREMLFPVSCTVSAIVELEDGIGVDAGSIGREGVVGTRWLYSDVLVADVALRCTVGGEAYAVPFESVRALAEHSAAARRLLDRYIRCRLDATLQLSACNAVHPVLQRCARLLLSLTASSGRGEIQITHETISEMLGTRRATVTIAFSSLIDSGAIATARGSLVVLDRATLRRMSCTCYDAIESMYAGVGLRALDEDGGSAVPRALHSA